MNTISVRPQVIDFALYAGDSFAVRFDFTDPDGDPWPLEGTWAAHIEDMFGEAITTFSVDDAEADGGVIYISLTGAQTLALLDEPSALWDFQQDYPGGPRTWYRGEIHTAGDVTP